MAISDANKARLNKMNRASQDALIGTAIQTAQNDITALQGFTGVKAGKVIVSAAQVTATKVEINTGKNITGQIVSIMRSDVQVGQAKVTFATTILKIESNSTNYVLTEGDVINYIVF